MQQRHPLHNCEHVEAETPTAGIATHDPILTREVVDAMEQGILVWSPDGVCRMHNSRILDVLDLRRDDIFVGCTRNAFLELAVTRGEIAPETAKLTEERFQRAAPFFFDRKLPSGRVVTTNARPMSTGDFVVTFTDVTAARRNERELEDAKQAAEEAESRARLSLAAEQARRQETRLLAELDEWLQSCKSLAELYQIVSAFMQQLLPGSAGELYIYSNSRDVLDGSCHWGDFRPLEHIQPDACWALRRGRGYEYGIGTVSFHCSHVEEQCAEGEQTSYICLPIVAHGDTVGLLHIKFPPPCADQDTDTGRDADLRTFAGQCAEHISLAIANVKLRDELRDQLIRDPLTGLFNRRYFIEMMRSELARAERHASTIGVIAFDADRFKTFNDNHGHDAGDMILRAIGDAVQAQFTNGETACRFGGEEFSILLPGACADTARQAAEELRRTIEAIEVRYRESTLPRVTISAGVASFPADGRLPQDVLKAANTALYAAKAQGRNTVVVAGSKAEHPPA